MTEFPKEKKNVEKDESSSFELILFNDDHHHFDFVIDKLKQHCNHSSEQAEQSALIAHHNGECSVLLGSEGKILLAEKKLAKDGLLVDSRKVLA